MSRSDRYAIYLADCDSEKVLKKLVGKAGVEDGLSRLDMLTKEESLMVLTRNLEVTHHIDENVGATKVLVEDINDNVKGIEGITLVTHHVDDNVEATKVLVEDINDNVKGIEEVTRNVDDNVEATKVLVEDINDNVKGIEGITLNVDTGMQHFLFVIYLLTNSFLCPDIVARELKRLLLPDTPIVDRQE